MAPAEKRPASRASEKAADRSSDSAPAAPISSSDEIFDVERVRRLVELMKEHDLNEVELRGGDRRIRLRRGPESTAPIVVASAPTASGAPPSGSTGAAKGEKAAPAADPASIVLIKSPMVGTFYSRPNPGAPAFVKPGDHINPETTVCIIEAMKVFNEIPAEARGKVVAILVGDGEAVDHGKPLFKIDTAG